MDGSLLHGLACMMPFSGMDNRAEDGALTCQCSDAPAASTTVECLGKHVMGAARTMPETLQEHDAGCREATVGGAGPSTFLGRDWPCFPHCCQASWPFQIACFQPFFLGYWMMER